MSADLESILSSAREMGASDVHLINGLPPAFRVAGDIVFAASEALHEPSLRLLMDSLLTEKQHEVFEKEWQLCFSRTWPKLGRFRASVYLHAGVPEFSIRIAERTIRSRTELRLPPIVDDLTRKNAGLILVSGPTGMGKTTTLNYMIDRINRERRAKIVTIEDPVEYVHDNLNSIVVQEELYTDVLSFRQALIHVLRQDPDVIAVGEMRDHETIATALTAAETGHLVIATLHTPDSVQSIQRIYSVFPSEQQNHVMYQLSNSLQAIIAQTLVPRADGKGLVLATEVCIATQAVRAHIREGQPHMLFSEIQTGRKWGMQTMDSSLQELYQAGDISYDAASVASKDASKLHRRAAAQTA